MIFMMDGATIDHDVAVISFSGRGTIAANDSVCSDRAAHDFVAGPENRLAAEAVGWIAARSRNSYSPLMLCGPPGTGKSHLARAAADWREDCVHIAAADFARELAEAIDAQAVEEFQARYRSTSLLILEDLGQLCGKRAALVEFQHTLDALEARDALVIVTSRIPPAEISGLPASLISRLSGGLVVSLSPPGLAARRVLLERLAASRGAQLSADALRLLTEKLTGSVVQLQGAIMELSVFVGVTDPPATVSVDLAAAKQFLTDRQPAYRPHLNDVGSTVAKFYGLKAAVLASSSRRRQVVLA